jgi:hypothetical protein
MNPDAFDLGDLYEDFKRSFLHSYHSSFADDASSFAFLKFLQRQQNAEFGSEAQALSYLWKTAKRALYFYLADAGRYSDITELDLETTGNENISLKQTTLLYK